VACLINFGLSEEGEEEEDSDSESEEDEPQRADRKKFKDVTVDEFKTWIGCLIAMGLNPSTELRDYWKKSTTDSGEIFCSFVATN
jgi:hypothetical protein